jgi:hypothetical protein
MKKIKGHVIRISHESFVKLKALKGKASHTRAIEALIETGEMVRGAHPVYRSGDRVFDDVAEARGYALQLAVREKRQPALPDVLVRIGQDAGD